MKRLLYILLTVDETDTIGELTIEVGDDDQKVAIQSRGPMRGLVEMIENLARETGEKYDAETSPR